jgi:hypothetical protein
MFPSCSVLTKDGLGSDHTPFIADTVAIKIPRSKQFRFEKWWLQVDGFDHIVGKIWSTPCRHMKPLIDGSLIEPKKRS